MNLRGISGFLTGPADDRYTPENLHRLTFTVMVRDDLGPEFPERVMIEDESLIARVRPRLNPGAAVVIGGRVRGWPVQGRGDALVAWDRWIVAHDVEITRNLGLEKEGA